MLHDEITLTNADVRINFTLAPQLYSLSQYVESILLNLISNALKYRHPDRVPVIDIASRRVNGAIEIEVKDNGIGIDLEKHRGSVFNLYKRFHFHVEGKGLGLFLVRTQVEALGGQIALASMPDYGSIFSIHLPQE